MGASGHGDYMDGAESAENQFACVSDGRRARPSGNIRIRDLYPIRKLVGESAEATAQHNAHCGTILDFSFEERFCLFKHQRSIPAMHADMKFAIDPAATAFKPMRA